MPPSYNAKTDRPSAELAQINDLNRKLGTYDLLTLVLGGVGVAALTVELIFYATGDDPDRYDVDTSASVSAAVELDVVPTPGGFAINGRF